MYGLRLQATHPLKNQRACSRGRARSAAGRTRPVLFLSIAALVAGVAVTLAAVSADSAAGFFVGTAIAGVGFGGGFQGGIRLVVPLAGERERAGVLSLLYIVSYLGLGVPAVIGGVLVTEVSGVLETAREYGSAVILLAALALADLLRRPAQAPAGAPAAVGCESPR